VRLTTLLAIPLAVSTPASAAIAIGTHLTVVLDFEQQHSRPAIREMQKEVESLLRNTGVRISLRMRAELTPHEDFEELVLVRFRGYCQMKNLAPLIDERGPLAWSHTVDGEILPFGEVACDKIRRAVEAALWGGQRARREELFGRALGRVVAHELYHIIGATHRHGKKGVAQAALSGQELIADQMVIENEDLARMRTRLMANRREPDLVR
jgi:hypothetical protein